jgi:hypothetical protein
MNFGFFAEFHKKIANMLDWDLILTAPCDQNKKADCAEENKISIFLS